MSKARRREHRRLDALYARLPKLECRGLCHESCGPIGASKAEVARLERETGRPLDFGANLTCSMLDANRRCAGYAVRPLICRLWGVVEAMRCPFGCVPERWLSREVGFSLLIEARDPPGVSNDRD